MNIRYLVPALSISLLSLAGCGAAATPASAPAVSAARAPAAAQEKAAGPAASGANDLTERLVIRNASLSLVVKDTQASLDEIGKMTTELKGFIQSSSTTKVDQALQATITIKIPADRLDECLARLRKLAIEVRSDKVSGQDVTAEYSDLQAQIKNLEAAEKQLQAILEKSTKTEDVLAVYRELTTIRGQIEQAKGRAQFLATSAAMSTVTIQLTPDKIAQPIQAPGWRPEGVVKDAVEALVRILQGLATLLIWMVITILPVLILLALPIVILIAIVRALTRRRRPKAQPAPMRPQQPPAPPMA